MIGWYQLCAVASLVCYCCFEVYCFQSRFWLLVLRNVLSPLSSIGCCCKKCIVPILVFCCCCKMYCLHSRLLLLRNVLSRPRFIVVVAKCTVGRSLIGLDLWNQSVDVTGLANKAVLHFISWNIRSNVVYNDSRMCKCIGENWLRIVFHRPPELETASVIQIM